MAIVHEVKEYRGTLLVIEDLVTMHRMRGTFLKRPRQLREKMMGLLVSYHCPLDLKIGNCRYLFRKQINFSYILFYVLDAFIKFSQLSK